MQDEDNWTRDQVLPVQGFTLSMFLMCLPETELTPQHSQIATPKSNVGALLA
jgi:hypothetical protein